MQFSRAMALLEVYHEHSMSTLATFVVDANGLLRKTAGTRWLVHAINRQHDHIMNIGFSGILMSIGFA